ncbi:MAG TPA: hypothetical protein VFQ23_06270 [Anaerolineales bacterium]|nr:hypothetical protein [Anaerolineales bacterium]
MDCIAYISIRNEEHESAATLLGAADALRMVIDSSITKVEQGKSAKEILTWHSMLGEERFGYCRDKGGKLTMDEAIDLAIVD